MPTTVTKKIGATNTPVTMDYSSIQAWEDACPADLTAVDQIYRGECYNQGTLGQFTISGETADATRYLVLTTGPGQSFRDNAAVRTTALFPSAANGVYIYGNFNYAVLFTINVGYTRLIGLQIEEAGASSCISTGGAGGVTIDSCIVRAAGAVGGNFDNGDTWVNCLLMAGTTFLAGTGPAVGNCYNCTIVVPTSLTASAGAGIHGSPYGDRRNHHNCAVFGFAKLQDGFGTGGTSDYAATDTTTNLEGAHTISGLTYASQFVSTVNDFRTVATGQLKAGSPDSTHAPVDISGFTRDTTTPYIGCWEPAGTGGPGGQTVTMPTRASGAQVFKPTISKAAPSVATTEWVPIWDLKPPVTGSGTVTAHHATHEPGGTDQITLLALGTTPATTGLLRLANNGAIMARKADNSADIRLMTLDASNVLQLAQGLTNVYVCDGGVTLSGTALAGGAGAVTIYSNPAYNDGTTGYPLQLSWFGSDARILSGSNRLVLQSVNLVVISPSAASTSQWWFDPAAFYPAGVTNTQDIGTTTARVRNIYVATVKTSAIKLAGDIQYESALGAGDRTYLTCSADGNLTLFDHNGSDFGRLQFGGTTSSYPALKRSSTGLAVRLANDSADAPLTAGTTTVNGDLYVTGDVIPITLAQLAKIDLLEQRSVGDTSGSRTLLSQSYVSGLSLRHDQAVGLAKITVGDYDQQVYQSLTFQSLSFQVATGTGPGTLVEHFRVHVSGGVTVGTDHSVDPGVGVIQASGGLGTTPGVALLNQRNVFTKFQTIQGSPTEPGMLAIRDVSGEGALLTLGDFTAPVNMHLWYLKSQGGGLSLMQADDNGGGLWSFQFYNSSVNFRAATGQTPIFTFNPEVASFPRLLAQDGALELRRNDNTGRVTLLAGGLGDTPLDASQLTAGTIPDARLSANVLKFTGGYPGGTTTFLRADGTFAAPAGGTVTAHHATHEPGGTDALVGAAWVALQNTFTANQTISKTTPGLFFQETAQVANSKLWELYVNGTAFYITSLTDAGSSIAGFGMDRTGNAVLSGGLTTSGNVRVSKTQPEVQLQIGAKPVGVRFLTTGPPGGFTSDYDAWLTSNLGYDGTNWQLDNTAGSGIALELFQGALWLYGCSTGTNPAALIQLMSVSRQGNLQAYGKITAGGNILCNTAVRPDIQVRYGTDFVQSHFMAHVNNSVIVSNNLVYDGTNWQRDDTAKGGSFIVLHDGVVEFCTAPVGANPASAALKQTFVIAGDGTVTIPNGTLTLSNGALTIQRSFPSITQIHTTGSANARRWDLATDGATYQFQANNDDGSASGNVPFVLTRAGSLLVASTTVPEVVLKTVGRIGFTHLMSAGGVSSGDTSLTANLDFTGGAWQRDDTARAGTLIQLLNGCMYVYACAPGANPANPAQTLGLNLAGQLSVTSVVASGGGTTLADLSVTGGTNFTQGILVTAGGLVVNEGNLQVTRAILSGGVMYPGRVDSGATQSGWYLGSHPSYGLYSNTGLYLAGGLWCGSILSNSINTQGTTITAGVVNASTLTTGSSYLPYGTGIHVNVLPTSAYYGIVVRCSPDGAVNSALLFVNNGNGGCGLINVNPAGTTSYGTSSDERLKKDRGRATDVTALREVVIHEFDWLDGTSDRGLFAQEAHTLFPRAIMPGLDDRTESGELVRPWMTDYSKLVPHLIVGWQHHEAEIASLKAELAHYKRRYDAQ